MAKNKSKILKGIAAAPGISIAEANRYTKEIEIATDGFVDDVNTAKEELRFAIEKSKKELTKVFSLAVDKLGEKRAAIFEAQIMILDDPVLIKNFYDRIDKEKRLPEIIVEEEISKYQHIMDSSPGKRKRLCYKFWWIDVTCCYSCPFSRYSCRRWTSRRYFSNYGWRHINNRRLSW
jgi:phosphotransferase system enzyme I (PtsI)